MKSKILIYVDNLNYLSDYRKVGISAFLFALEGYSVGYKTYTIEELKKIEVSNKYILINRILDCQDVDNLRQILPSLVSSLQVKGIVFEDIAVYRLVKSLGLELELILFQNHFASNLPSVNFWLKKVDSIIINNEITINEIASILEHADGNVCLHLYGYNQVMYSRRLLLTNWCEEFDIPFKDTNILTDTATKVKFRALENEYGTVMYSDKIFNGVSLLSLPFLDKVKYFYVNPTLIAHKQVLEFLNKINDSVDNFDYASNEDDGFLNKETIYKLRERSK